MTICCVSEKILTAYLRNTLYALFFFASLHLTIFERPANFNFFSQLKALALKPAKERQHHHDKDRDDNPG
jgi:hypothetical protein